MRSTAAAVAVLAGLGAALPTATEKTISRRVDDPSSAQVTAQNAFDSGAGVKTQSADGTGNGTDSYTCYYGGWQSFPSSDKWVTFDDMFNANKAIMKNACQNLGDGDNDTGEQIGMIYNAIQQVANSSLVDRRYILATIIQESNGCVNVGTTDNGVSNPGLMQSHDGSSFVGSSASTEDQQNSITQMVVDGTQGTSSGDGLVQGINMYGNIYEAARYYNSGQVNQDDLNDPQGATASYVTDIANRMTGWVLNGGYNC